MLDVIADFWKPVKKAPQPESLKPELLQIGSSMGFGFVPQAMLSGRRLHITAINTYLFGEESLTSFVLSQDKDPSVSMIVAESEGEYYLAISRRIALSDRARLFDEQELETVMSRQDAVRLTARDAVADYKGWAVPSYKREIQGLKGVIFKGDYRRSPLPSVKEGHEFEYTLLVSDSNEHAIEIEKYTDGRVEVYTTVYRRMNDIGEVAHPLPPEAARPDVRLASSQPELLPVPAQAPVMSAAAETQTAAAPAPQPVSEPLPQPAMAEAPLRTEPLTLQELPLPSASLPVSAPAMDTAPAPAERINPGVFTVSRPAVTAAPAAAAATPEPIPQPTRTDMSIAEALKPKLYVNPSAPDFAGEMKNNGRLEDDAIECDLRVANKIIDEAIRNEMRLTDIVRRIIELPVAYPESVQIPMTLTDNDYSLLAIRYGISASDRNAIKRRIIEDLNDFSGKK